MTRTLEVRRHSLRKTGGGSQLSQAGVDLARRVGAGCGPYDLVVASVAPRTRETAVAMGFAVDHELVTLATDDELYKEMEAARWWEDAAPMAALARLCGARGPTWRFGHSLSGLWRDLLTPLPDGGRALVITHSGDLELALVCAFPERDHAGWGAPFQPLEGAVLTFGGQFARFTGVEFIRGPF